MKTNDERYAGLMRSLADKMREAGHGRNWAKGCGSDTIENCRVMVLRELDELAERVSPPEAPTPAPLPEVEELVAPRATALETVMWAKDVSGDEPCT